MVFGGAGLEDCCQFQRPGRDQIALPSFQVRYNRFDLGEIIEMVRAEIKSRPLSRTARDGFEELGLQQAVLVVPGLGPRIGK